MDVIRFTHVARVLGSAGHSLDLTTPVAFRSPPRKAGESRTLRRTTGDTAVISVQLRDRPDADVIRDLVAGVMAANRQSVEHSNHELLLEAAWDACVRDAKDRPDFPAPTREELGLKVRQADIDKAQQAELEAALAHLSEHEQTEILGSNPPTSDPEPF